MGRAATVISSAFFAVAIELVLAFFWLVAGVSGITNADSCPFEKSMLWNWFRALVYMCIIGMGWLIVLPVCLLHWQSGRLALDLRGWPFVVIGLVLFAKGVGIALWAGYHLIHHGQGTPFPLDAPRRLVTTGPYRFVRNPQAIAMILMVVGEILIVKSSVLLLMLPFTILYLEVLVGPMESRQLARDFGLEYQTYAARVPKWIPRKPRNARQASSSCAISGDSVE